MHDIALEGCRATPLAGYLKALGVLRLLAEQKDSSIRGYWQNDAFVLRTALERKDIEDFFLHDYAPTPVMAPWNGGSGFYQKDNKAALTAIRNSSDSRLCLYRECLEIAEDALQGMNRSASPKGEAKAALLMDIRARMPDAVLPWFDAAVSLTSGTAQYPPLLGTGGNDGRLDFTNNFMQRLLDVLGLGPKSSGSNPRSWLATALYAVPAPGLVKSAIGQFSPGQVGGPNATTGLEADSLINPWDFVLMIEGALTFAAAVVRRHANDPAGVLSYPFTVRAVGAGSGAVGQGDEANARGDLWMPLWSGPATYAEVRTLMAEGRVVLGRKPARDALDFVRAVHRLGSYRGIHGFQRFGLLMRSGKAYLAIPLKRIQVREQPKARWLDELDKHGWLDRFRHFARGDRAANRFHVLRKRLEDALFDLSGREPRREEAQALMILLGQIQAALAQSEKAREVVPPVPRLSERWVTAADDGTPAFRIAKALAGIGGVGDEPLPLRVQLFPVRRRYNRWMTADAGERIRFYTGRRGRLPDVLIHFLERRLLCVQALNLPEKPLKSPAGVTPDDLVAFLRDDAMDARIQNLVAGLCICNIPEDHDKSVGDGTLPAAFALLKLALIPDGILRSLGLLGEQDHVPVPGGMVAQLAVGNRGNRAVQMAWRRLHASGLTPVFSRRDLPDPAGIDPRRAAAALLIPLRFGAVGRLARQVLEPGEMKADVA
ncbi:CRISPR-associated protein Csx17 [Desulfacinum hydrothermale DSM 13146]|uniref:CRISPR-associated protein Csx17 n=1 Tax=Desulfacinum hydrothermale DSM 13146 TaxID=1121390 RepID=A0A1W1XVG0_9BACT|nr:type I-U CRISPR-associated protein Csx17 [Desulfacinum hydrothermale]SMC27939.1 CRISPR-associated protein Csx17 [Desulfacinum hydrothermale DSM 13146]